MTNRSTPLRLVAAGLTLAATSPLVAHAEAPPPPSFGMRAGLHGVTTLEGDHFTYAVTRGTTLRDTVEVSNNRPHPVTVDLYAVDLLQADGGGLAPAQPTAPRTSAGAWITLSRSRVTVPGGRSTRVPFTLYVPATATPGEHLAAVVGSTLAGRTRDGLAVQTRVALQARVRVQGKAAPALQVDTPEADRSGRSTGFTVSVRNTGNVLLTLDGELRVGDGHLRLNPAGVYVIPGGTATLTARWTDTPTLGRPRVEAVIAALLDGRSAGTFRSPTLQLTYVPWLLTGGVALVVAAVITTTLLLRPRQRARHGRRRRAGVARVGAGTPPAA